MMYGLIPILILQSLTAISFFIAGYVLMNAWKKGDGNIIFYTILYMIVAYVILYVGIMEVINYIVMNI